MFTTDESNFSLRIRQSMLSVVVSATIWARLDRSHWRHAATHDSDEQA